MSDVPALLLASATLATASPDARAASATGGIDPPPSAGPDPSAPPAPREPIANPEGARHNPFAIPKKPETVSVSAPPIEAVPATAPPVEAVPAAACARKVIRVFCERADLPRAVRTFVDMPLAQLQGEVRAAFNLGDRHFTLELRHESQLAIDTQSMLQVARNHWARLGQHRTRRRSLPVAAWAQARP